MLSLFSENKRSQKKFSLQNDSDNGLENIFGVIYHDSVDESNNGSLILSGSQDRLVISALDFCLFI